MELFFLALMTQDCYASEIFEYAYSVYFFVFSLGSHMSCVTTVYIYLPLVILISFNLAFLINNELCTKITKFVITSIKKLWVNFLFLKIIFIYFFRERGREGRKRGRETSMRGCLLHAPYWGPGPQPRHVPWLESNFPFGSKTHTQSTELHQPGKLWVNFW